MLNCVIVDDEPLAREGLADYVREVDFLRLTGTCMNPVELGMLLRTTKTDLVFLDIQMPKMSGIEFLRIVQHPPLVVITSAHPEYALDGFQLNVLDYLLKPITFERFFQAAGKALEYHRLLRWPDPGSEGAVAPEEAARPDAEGIVGEAESGDIVKGGEGPADFFFIKCGNRYEKIVLAEILFIQGLQNYVSIHTTRGKFLTLLNLKKLEQSLDNRFIRVHKSYIVSIGHIDALDGNELILSTHRIPLSRNYRDLVIGEVVHKNLITRHDIT